MFLMVEMVLMVVMVVSVGNDDRDGCGEVDGGCVGSDGGDAWC